MCMHGARRYQRKEAKIEGWESLQKCKFEAKLRQAEVFFFLFFFQSLNILCERSAILN
jgi:hypothetical protein